MLGYRKFIFNESAMSNTFGEMRGVRHVKNYIAPFLSKEGLAKTKNAFGDVRTPIDTMAAEDHGSLYDSNSTHTHYLHSSHNSHSAETPIKITHAFHKDGKIYAATESHGDIPLSKIAKPKGLKKTRRGESGFSIEKTISQNLGTQAAGSSNKDKDFTYHHKKDAPQNPSVRGEVKVAESPLSPAVRGESKLEKGRFGVTSLKHENGQWSFAGQTKMHAIFKKAMALGPDGITRPILDHLNQFAPDGIIQKGFSVGAPKGTARHYVKNSDVNALHLHDKSTGNSTTFTYGNELKGRTALGHLENTDLDNLDGRITIEPGAPGKGRIAHSPNVTEMRRLAALSATDSQNHRTLEKKEHADEFMSHIDTNL